MLDVDLLFGNGLERGVNRRIELSDRAAGPLDLEFHRHFLSHGIARGRPGSVGIAENVATEYQCSERRRGERSNDGFL